MFNSTHTLVGLALARTGIGRWVPHAAWTAVIAANLPDVDIVTGLYDTAAYIQHHRGITHTFIGIPILSLVLAAVMCRFSGNFWKTFVVALVAMATHPLLDYANTYGVRPFLPFSQTWYYGDLLFVIDPYFDAILLGGILLGRFFRSRRDSIAFAAFALVFLYTATRYELRNRARAHLSEFASGMPQVRSTGVSPQMFSPLAWNGFVDTAEDISIVAIDVRAGVGGPIIRTPKAPVSDILVRAATARSAAAFLAFARFPVIRVEQLETGYAITFADMRFYRGVSDTAFAARVLLDSSLRVAEESVGFNQRIFLRRNRLPSHESFPAVPGDKL